MKNLTPKMLLFSMAASLLFVSESLQAAEKEMTIGPINLRSPKGWESKEPKFKGIVAYEFAIPAVKGDESSGRVTLGRLGGGIEANVDRWLGQISQPDGKPTKERAKVTEKEISGHKVILIDVSGTYKSRFPRPVTHENYRLLGALIVTKGGAAYIKCLGPRKTMAANEKAFEALVSSLKVK